MYQELKAGALKGLRLGLLHGRMDADEKEIMMRRFQRREVDVMISTTVIEVGVDVPNATMMVIEHAERFGLSQMHQLRGRVGRGNAKSYCILMTGGKISPRPWSVWEPWCARRTDSSWLSWICSCVGRESFSAPVKRGSRTFA